ncbi:MAG: zinc ribbon domain-containing protein [Clostridia bacterium]|nr:zinc ribbon domain-containing protein [Clostridia bacterium]
MECFNCGQENNEDAVFCKQCGLRVDGKVVCQKCNRLIDYDSQFCEFCGNSRKEDSEETYTDTVETDEPRVDNSIKTARLKLGKKKIFEICSGIFFMFAVFFSLLFTFFIGLKVNNAKFMVPDENANYLKSLNIFYYFGECYANADLIKDYPSFYVSNYYFTSVIGTLLSIAIIVTVIIFAIIATIRYINYINGKSQKSYSTFSLATTVSFIIGVTLFYSFNCATSYKSGTEMKVILNDYTIAGAVLTTLFTVLACLFKTATLGKILTSQQNLRKFCFSALSIVLLAFIATLIASPSIIIKAQNNYEMSFNSLSAMTMLSVLYLTKNLSGVASGTVTSKYSEAPIEIYTNLIIAFIIEIAMIVMVILMIATLLKNLSNNNKQSNFRSLGISISGCILSIAYMIITLTAEKEFVDYLDSEILEYSFNIALLILPVVVSVIYLATEIVHFATNVSAKMRKFETEDIFNR